MSNLARFETLVREHAALLVQLQPLQERAAEMRREIDEEKARLSADGVVVDEEAVEDGEGDTAEQGQDVPSATKAERVVALLQEYAGLEWTVKEIAEFLDVGSGVVTQALPGLLDAGRIIRRRGKFLIDDE